MEVMKSATLMGHEQVVFCHDPTTGLKAIIAIHDTTLGPALGGTRFWDYEKEEDALFDVLRLSRGMTYKAAISGLTLGGGKSVIIGDSKKLKSPELFKAFGKFVNSLSGRYITAEDVNVRVEDMDYVRQETNYVTGITGVGGSGDPSPITALGVFWGIKAAVKHRLQQDSLKGLRIGVQGVGAVGYNLCQLLSEEGAHLVVGDLNEASVNQAVQELGATAVNANQVHHEKLDVFAPCAMGAILNEESIKELQCPIVAGGANNQLLDEKPDMKRIEDRKILLAPDYVINAGGLINVSHELKGFDPQAARKDAQKIYHTLLGIFNESEERGISTIEASNQIAERRLQEKRSHELFCTNTYDNQDWICNRDSHSQASA